MKFYVLTSSSLEGLRRICLFIRKEELVVVINTTNKEYEVKCSEFCERFTIPYHITESDGTPATGKNSVIKLFLESDDDYMVQIDGDDILTIHGYGLYKDLASCPSPPDMVVLYRQPRVAIKDIGWLREKWDGRCSSFDKDWNLCYPSDKSDPIYANQTKETLYQYFRKVYRVNHEISTRWAIDRIEMNDKMIRYSESKEYMCRMVFYSRKAAEYVHFDNSITIGEDTIQFLLLKKLAFENKLRILRRCEIELPTYLYTENPHQITMVTPDMYHTYWDWMRPFLDKLSEIEEGLPEFVSLPEFKDEMVIYGTDA